MCTSIQGKACRLKLVVCPSKTQRNVPGLFEVFTELIGGDQFFGGVGWS